MMCDFVEMGFIPVRKWRPGRVVEGTSLLRKHMGLNLYRGFESLGLRQDLFSNLQSFKSLDLTY